jgi:hypothetical protein
MGSDACAQSIIHYDYSSIICASRFLYSCTAQQSCVHPQQSQLNIRRRRRCFGKYQTRGRELYAPHRKILTIRMLLYIHPVLCSHGISKNNHLNSNRLSIILSSARYCMSDAFNKSRRELDCDVIKLTLS